MNSKLKTAVQQHQKIHIDKSGNGGERTTHLKKKKSQNILREIKHNLNSIHST